MLNVRNEEGIIIAEFDHGKVNSITGETLKKLRDVVKSADEDDSIRGIILTGAGRTFSGGFDLPMFLGFKTIEEIVAFFEEEEEILIELFICRKPVVSAINGHAIAGGLIVSMASDYRIAKNHPKINLGMSEIKIGLPLSLAQAEIMRFGFDSDRKYRDMMYFGRMMNVDQAKEFGIVDEIVEEADLLPRAKKIVSKWIDNPGRAFIKLKEGLKKPAADRIRQRLAGEDWRSTLNCFFDKDVRGALEFVLSMM
ncbi:MAG: enoyl-CoA hydratase/isomerase family protein [Desulfomonilia bacterium]|jgi:enoyl-CoA hydratase/carnithine racemase|nr:enoyl-CoA hydratase/isomerase family protein [Deltaproteobacteria bacterium]MDX9760522.1 enoyl-CoA hydratase/isomerase family protein [Desulfomonilia bacterium]HPW68900.1 enoyl-CoA hydratase/isomerase family protein [Deltaproteobacteria bacterium]